MTGIRRSARDYETWLRRELGSDIVEPDLREKRRKMREGPFQFLRATYWRWAETILDICPELADSPPVLAIGDTHLENFGTWRDSEGRLVWGVNDFDEAAWMPYALDLVRLGTSALLARGTRGPSATIIADALLDGYRRSISDPRPIVLEREHKWLRKTVMLRERERAAFWDKMEHLKPAKPSDRFKRALCQALPDREAPVMFARRTAGTGSLGRPRFVAQTLWRGGPVGREAKALVPSGWSLVHAPHDRAVHAEAIARGRHRAPDPHYRAADGIVVRRLSPNSRKIEVDDDADDLLSPALLSLMGFDVANCHADQVDQRQAIRADLERRRGDWLCRAAGAAASGVEAEQKRFT